MNKDLHRHAGEIFLELCRVAEPERAAMVELKCAGDAMLRARVEEMLRHDPGEPTAGEGTGPPDPSWAGTSSVRSPLPTAIGPYRVLRELGRGGMGVVVLASREDDHFHKRVAIKLVKLGMDTAEILRRFDLERQVLAALTHPNIARLMDAGQSEDGRPYVVMEYVEGLPIDGFCDFQRLSIIERLRLFLKVCSAVHHAHQNLIVHRDLKPANIVVGSDSEPRLLDFGIAKLLNPDIGGISLATAPALQCMTPEYASPEQVSGQPISTATDVYSLGVLLYELLTGHRPYPSAGSEGFGELSAMICNVEPERPSTRITQSRTIRLDDGTTRVVTPAEICRARDETMQRLRHSLAGDLDNIILKAMHKAPRRRYESALQLAEDIQRHIDGMPVLARADTVWYRTDKFVRRNRGMVALALIASLSLAGGALVSELRRRETEQMRARAERQSDHLNRLVPLVLRLADAQWSRRAPNKGDLLSTIDQLTKARDSLLQEDPEATVRDTRTALVLATIDVRLADAVRGVGAPRGPHDPDRLLDHASSVLEGVAHEAGDPAIARAKAVVLASQGEAMMRRADFDGASRAFAASLDISEDALRRAPQDLDAMRDVSVARIDMGAVLAARQESASALQHYTRALELRVGIQRQAGSRAYDRKRCDRDVMVAHEKIGGLHLSLQRPDDAASHLRACYALAKRLSDEDHNDSRALWDLCRADYLMFKLLELTDDLDVVRQQLDDTLAHTDQLARTAPADLDYAREWIKTRREAAYFLDDNSLGGVRKYLDPALERARGLLANGADDDFLRSELRQLEALDRTTRAE